VHLPKVRKFKKKTKLKEHSAFKLNKTVIGNRELFAPMTHLDITSVPLLGAVCTWRKKQEDDTDGLT